jgi:hypothetical protein
MLRRIDPRILIALCMIRMNAMYAGKMMISKPECAPSNHLAR